MFKAWHKVIAAPLAITSVGITVYLINLWKTPSILDASVEKIPEVDEEIPTPEPEQGTDEEKQEGSVDEKAQEKEQEKNTSNQGNKGQGEETTTKEEEKKQVDNSNNEKDSKQAKTEEEKSKDKPNVISNKGSNDEIINERAIEKEIKKLIDKIIREKSSWITDTYTLKNTFQIHELMDIGNKLLQQIQRVQKI